MIGRVLSGIQSTQPKMHLGNYEGAVKHWVELQKENQLICFIADLHSLTTMYENTSKIAENSLNLVRELLAVGVDPNKSVLFIQSHVKQHMELHLLLSMITPLGWLERVPTYKDKRQQIGEERESYGLLGYPTLQSADILLYRPIGVPVGRDQAPHLEITREILRRFNHLYGPVFPEFTNFISDTPLLMGLDGRKMSKSYGNSIYLADTEEETAIKIKTAYTDPEKIRKNDPGHPEGCSIYALHCVYNKSNVKVVEEECKSGARGCVQCKKECTEAVNDSLKNIRENMSQISFSDVSPILKQGAQQASNYAQETLDKVYDAMKFSPKL